MGWTPEQKRRCRKMVALVTQRLAQGPVKDVMREWLILVTPNKNELWNALSADERASLDMDMLPMWMERPETMFDAVAPEGSAQNRAFAQQVETRRCCDLYLG